MSVLPAIMAPAIAATDTATLTVSATVASSCSLNSATLDFGTYSSGQSANLDSAGTIGFDNCEGNLTFELDGGQSGAVQSRTMASGGNTLTYQLFRDSNRTNIFGTGSNALQQLLLVPQSGTVPVYGRIPQGQAVPAGTYTDTVNITLTF
ncbi:MAG: spore coat U domain-containing protein [Geminicoccaceae bacterium]